MLENMYAVIDRINQIKSRLGLASQSAQNTADNSFADMLNNNIKSAQDLSANNIQKTGINDIKKVAELYAEKNQIPPNLVNAVIEVESGFKHDAVSNKGAAGLMQLMPSVARSFGVEDPFNIEQNISGGVKLLKELLEKYDWDYAKALAAYNAGEGAVDKKNGIPDYPETKEYVKKVVNAYLRNNK